MSFLSVLSKGIHAMIDEATTPESFKIGQKFEDYVRKELFIERYYDLLEKTHDYNTNSKDYVQSSLKPDFKFLDKWNKREFYVEAKFRTGLFKGKIKWCNENQLKRYQEYDKKTPVFLILGLGEEPDLLDSLFLIPISLARYTELFPKYAERFKIKTDTPVSSKILWS